MKKLSKVLALFLSVIMVSALFMGCGSQKAKETGSSGGPSGKIMIYTSMYPDIINQMKPELKKAFPNLDVEWFQGGSETVMSKMAGEIDSNKINVDILMVADPAYYMNLKSKDLLLKYKSPSLKDVTTGYDADGSWSSVRVDNMIIAYNSNKVKDSDAPKTWKDLLDSKWKGKMGMPNPTLSGTAYDAVCALADKYSWDYFSQLKKNGMKVDDGNTTIQNKLNTGEYSVAMILEENILKIAAKGEPMKVVYPSDGVVTITSPIGIMKSTKNPEACKAVEDWFLSKDGQNVITKGWMHSVRNDVDSPKGAQKLSSFLKNSMKMQWSKYNTENEKNKEKFKSTMID